MEYLRLVQSPVTVWLPPIWSEAWPLARAGDFLVSLTPITLITAGIGARRGVEPSLAHAGDRLRTRLAGLCGRRPGRGAVRRRRPPPPHPDPRSCRRDGGPLRHADRRAIWRPRLRRRVPVRPQGADRRHHRRDRLGPRRDARRLRRGLVRDPVVRLSADRGARHGALCGPGRVPDLPARRLARLARIRHHDPFKGV